jgi:hypothetical protein|tara:strand:+ start:334 stop:552 length:219 start_codon:yes stop_codon:yes gene_type:complete
MSRELLKRYYEAERLHEEKFGEPPAFKGMFMPAIDGEFYIDSIYYAIRTNKPVNELRDMSVKEREEYNKAIW